MNDFSFQGKIWLGSRQPNGKPGVLNWVGDAPALQLKFATSTSPRTESFTGLRQQSGNLLKGTTASGSMTLNYFGTRQLALGLYGSVREIAEGTATAEPLPAGMMVGDTIALDFPNATDIVLVDSTGTPKTLVEDTDYVIESPTASLVTLKSLGSPAYMQPFKAAYSYPGGVDVTMFTAPVPERYLLLDGINTADNSRVLARLWRCQFQPFGQLDLISDDWGQLATDFSVLFDPINAADSNLGGFGKFTLATGS